jgi:beta-glucosidase
MAEDPHENKPATTVAKTPPLFPRADDHVLASDLTLDEKLALFGGDGPWNFRGVPRLGIPALQVGDCGHGITLAAPPYGSATCFPTSVGMAATWNLSLLYKVGRALGRETRAKGCSMLLGPMVNLHRLPCGGRNYETFSEDPILTGKLAAAIVRGLQSEGTGACVKSFACNNQQTAQSTTSSEVDSKTLRELYLKVFAVILAESDPWAVMTSYNPLNGHYPSDDYGLLTGLLREELGFPNVVVSDWHAVQGEGALFSGLDIEMPGPAQILTPERLESSMKGGKLSIEEIDTRVDRILKLHARVSLARQKDKRYSPPELNSRRHADLAREVAEESIVLLQNEENVLPLDHTATRRVAVIGPNAATARLGGGGSASVLPPYAISVLQGLQNLGHTLEIEYAEGCSLNGDSTAIPPDAFLPRASHREDRGLNAKYFTADAFDAGHPPQTESIDPAIDFSWGWAAPIDGLPRNDYAVRWEGQLRSPCTGTVTLSLATNEGLGRVWLDDELILDCWSSHDPHNFEDRFTNRHATTDRSFVAGASHAIRVEFRKTGTRAGIRLAWKTPGADDQLEQAAQLAAKCDCAIVVVGLSNMFEGGNCDREQFEMPGQQEELIRRVAAANRRTVVVLYNGTPVSFRAWRDAVPAILEAFYPGQEGGNAIARILFGKVTPSGKLPDTIPYSWEELPAMKAFPGQNGKAVYSEGRLVGYRYYDQARRDPEFPFGFGLSYTRFQYTPPILVRPTSGANEATALEILTTVKNVGSREGKETVQLYYERIEPDPGDPLRELLDFTKLLLQPGECREVRFHIPLQAIANYHVSTATWHLPPGPFRLAIGPHSRALQNVTVSL